jgi:hypothetical protein
VIDRFYLVARTFSAWTEQPPDGDPERCRTFLTALYSAVLDLPAGVAPQEPPSSVSDERWNAVRARFAHLPFRYYTTVINPLAYPVEDMTVADVADDLADLYRDLEDGIVLYDRGAFDEAAWHWRHTFRSRWGRRLLGALGATHAFLERTVASAAS